MAPSPARRTASELLAIPVITDGDVLDRVAAVISPAARRYRTLWLFFLHDDATQANLVVPIDDLPERPGADVIGSVCQVAAQSVARAPSLRSVVITLARPGPPRPTGADRHLLRVLRHGASRHATPVRMLVLATPGGVRELGPVRPLREKAAAAGAERESAKTPDAILESRSRDADKVELPLQARE
jgi:hypothetical protein